MTNDNSTPEESCHLCGRVAPFSFLGMAGANKIIQCQLCGGESCRDIPNRATLEKAYQNFDAGELARKNYIAYVTQATSILSHETSQFAPELVGSAGAVRFLDYGCGGGHFVAAAQHLGFTATGLELDSESVAFGQSNGLDIRRGTLPDSEPGLGSNVFDFVRSMHVLEHVPTPFSVLASIKSITKPGGLIIICVPDQGSFPSRLKIFLRNFWIKRREWGFIQPPIHLHGFYEATFVALARLLDLDLIGVMKTSPLDSREFPPAADYWEGIAIQRTIYNAATLLGSPGHLKVVFKKH